MGDIRALAPRPAAVPPAAVPSSDAKRPPRRRGRGGLCVSIGRRREAPGRRSGQNFQFSRSDPAWAV